MKFYKILFLGILLFCAGQSGFAQVEESSMSSSGSFYSLFGAGYPTDYNNAREAGMGIIGVSLYNSQSNSLQNPAIWGTNAFTTASSGFNLSQFQANTGDVENVNAMLEPGYFQVTLPLYREKLGLSASMYSVTRTNYRFVTVDSTESSPGNTIGYASDIRGTGGINKLEFGLGWNISPNISIGYAPAFTFISQNNSQDVFFNQSGYNSSFLDARITGNAISHRFGTLLNFQRIFNSRDRISFGAAATLPVTIDAKETRIVTKMVSGVDQEVELREPLEGEISLPLDVKAGLTYYPSNLVNVSAEGLFEQWSEYSSDFDQNLDAAELKDRFKAGLGAEYHPYRTNSGSFLSNFRYSGGISYDTGHLKVEGENINTLWFSAGLGIISPRSNSSVALSVRYGLRGTTNQDLIREEIWSFNLSVNLSELMFVRRKLQ
ncbi:hypothetical protein [Gracilimonas tropica]|uniref:hypothetical protein n=1 Tax=Gracilimonas tropica TaxID=454600 RepID=UPI000382D3C6|nr:hypothetical protein [Gracilimonas tropica]